MINNTLAISLFSCLQMLECDLALSLSWRQRVHQEAVKATGTLSWWEKQRCNTSQKGQVYKATIAPDLSKQFQGKADQK